jgi:hypothetical protein
LPLLESEVDISIEFAPEEPLFRRVSANELTDGEIDPSSLNSVSFNKEISGAPSVLRGKFASPSDVLHVDCAGGKDVSSHLVYFILVRDVPDIIHSDDGKSFAFYPLHLPVANCGAHSVIASCLAGDKARVYAKPSRPVRNALRAKLATRLQPVPDPI